jgi:hypothetical protein
MSTRPSENRMAVFALPFALPHPAAYAMASSCGNLHRLDEE